MRISYRRVRVETARVPDSAEARRRRSYMRLQYFFDGGPESQIGETDYSRRNPRVAVLPARALRGDTIHEFGLAHRPQRFGAVRAIHRETFDKDGRDYPMTGSGIAQY